MLEFDRVDMWADNLRTALADELLPDIERILASAKPEYIEDAYDLLQHSGNRIEIIEKVVAWLRSQPYNSD